jgi:hypothetical protein
MLYEQKLLLYLTLIIDTINALIRIACVDRPTLI